MSFPETKPDLSFEKMEFVVLVFSELKTMIDWDQRKYDFEKIIENYRKDGKGYDCLIPVSGGKDSTYQAYFIEEARGMNPCVSVLRLLMLQI